MNTTRERARDRETEKFGLASDESAFCIFRMHSKVSFHHEVKIAYVQQYHVVLYTTPCESRKTHVVPPHGMVRTASVCIVLYAAERSNEQQ